MASIHDILRPITLTKVISRVAATTDTLLMWMGMQTGGRNEVSMGHGREGSYNVYNHVRKIASGRGPGTAAGRRSRNAIGRVPFVYPRMHDSVGLLAEELHNFSKIDDPRTRDEAGTTYVRMQTKSLAQAGGNWRTAMVVGMLRDSLYIVPDGDTWYPSYTDPGGAIRVNFQMPAGNKTQLNMLAAGNIIDASWLTASTNIPLHLAKIQAATAQLNGGMITDIIVSSIVWSYIIQNDYIQGYAGTSNSPFTTWAREVGQGPDGSPLTEQVGTIVAAPGVTFHITDSGLEVGAPGSEAFSKHVPDTAAVFMCSPRNPDLYSMYLGSEPIAERDGGPKNVKTGFAAWSNESANPTVTNVFVLDNAIPVNHTPNSIAYGTVVF